MSYASIFYIIDDDTEDQDFLMQAIKDIDPSVICITALNGQEGLRKLKGGSVPIPSLIFLDLNMPRINGKQFLIELRNDPSFQSVPVIIYTTSSHKKEVEEMMNLGATAYLEKQWNYLDLKEKLSKLLLSFLSAK